MPKPVKPTYLDGLQRALEIAHAIWGKPHANIAAVVGEIRAEIDKAKRKEARNG